MSAGLWLFSAATIPGLARADGLIGSPDTSSSNNSSSEASKARADYKAQSDQANPGPEPDPFEPFNSAMFTFNLKLDDYVLHPVASGYAKVMPQPGREAVGRFFDNIGVIPRFANNLFQLRFVPAGTEVARFGINSTVGVLGLFDPADKWFGLKANPDDFGLTIRYYNVPTGPYLMLPFLGPRTIGDAIGQGVDGLMNPMDWLLPWYITLPVNGGTAIVEAVNYRSLHLNQFEEADRYAIDLYAGVQDAYLQTRQHRVDELQGKGQ